MNLYISDQSLMHSSVNVPNMPNKTKYICKYIFVHFATGATLFEVQARWVLRDPTQFDSRSQNRFCLYLDPPIVPFSHGCQAYYMHACF